MISLQEMRRTSAAVSHPYSNFDPMSINTLKPDRPSQAVRYTVQNMKYKNRTYAHIDLTLYDVLNDGDDDVSSKFLMPLFLIIISSYRARYDAMCMDMWYVVWVPCWRYTIVSEISGIDVYLLIFNLH